MISQKSHHIDNKIFLQWKFNFAIEIEILRDYLMISIVWNCHIEWFFIANNNFAQKTLYRKSKAAEISSIFFLFISFNSCGMYCSNFWILPNWLFQSDKSCLSDDSQSFCNSYESDFRWTIPLIHYHQNF